MARLRYVGTIPYSSAALPCVQPGEVCEVPAAEVARLVEQHAALFVAPDGADPVAVEGAAPVEVEGVHPPPTTKKATRPRRR